MTDKQLVRFAAEFRRGMIGGNTSHCRCFLVCFPLASLLRMRGVVTDMIDVDLSDVPDGNFANHVWLRLSDGRALDPTMDQFNNGNRRFPKVYLGELVPGIHFVAAPGE